MSTSASRSPAARPARIDAVVHPALADGRTTTVHVARWSRVGTRVRIARLAPQRRLADWCAETGTSDALVGGFYARPSGVPLGEVRLHGEPVAHEAFTTPWNLVRACLHVATSGALRIDRRDRLEAHPAGDLLQAGPLLVRGGRVVCRDGSDGEGFAAGAHQFDSDITAGRHPRAALGIGRGELLAVVADGRSPDDAGLTLGELARVLAGLGATTAMNLDGGGSASLVCDGQLRNRPREQHGIELAGGRAITTVIAFDAA
ncbi:MAG TPA: phosphodiester glycosidase family protein [Solirubrobacteraceae bacterium]|nr:phosphodiester glycosidase family protein [Solirubrobacteraceae bacterium]